MLIAALVAAFIGMTALAIYFAKRLRHAESRLGVEGSARAQAERALSDQERRLQTIFESQVECVKLHDATGTILTMNRAGIARLGAGCAAQVVGTSVYNFISPEHHERYRALTAAVFEGRSESMEFLLICAMGKRRLFETHVVPMRDSGGSIVAALALTCDITDRRNAEERAQRHLSDLARVARITSMGEMASGLAHELNQPLAAIVNHASACLNRLRASSDTIHKVIESLEAINEQGQRAGQIIRTVRELVSRAEPTKTLVNVNEIVRMMVLLASPEADRHGVKVVMQLDSDPLSVFASKVELEQVVFNLIRNAVEATGDVDASHAGVVVATKRGQDDGIVVSVQDGGCGIASDDFDRVFDPFFTTKTDGIGMGLSISRSIIEAHDGRIFVRPNVDRGVTFEFSIPSAAQEKMVA